MQKSSFKVFSSVFILFFFLATPGLAFAQSCPGGNCGLKNKGAGAAGGGAGLDPQSLLVGGLLSGALGGGRGGLGTAGGGGGPAGQVGQVLTLVGALTGNMGLLIAGMITGMLGGLAGGATPQQGAVDEQYVGQGQGYGNGGGGNPYYPTPTPVPGSAQAACTSSVFIVKDTTVTPNVTKPYPATSSIAQNNCVLAINSDTAAHTVKIKKQGETNSQDQVVGASVSHVFRFTSKNTYTLCIDSVSTACTIVTVQ